MHIVLWDTRKNDVQKDFAGGMGVGMYPGGGGIRGALVRRFYQRDYRPVALNFPYLAAVFQKLGHTVEYALDRLPTGGDLYVFNPALMTVEIEQRVMREALALPQKPQVLAVGQVAYAMPEAFTGVGAKVARGEAEQLLWKLDEVLASDEPVVNIGSVADLDALPFPDWSPFQARKFKIVYDFWKFPTALIQHSRGCTFTCNYCPYIMVENKTRIREPEAVAEEMAYGIKKFGFRSFKFRDPLFGLNRKKALQLAELIKKLPKKVQFSVESRIDLMRPETLTALKEAGLTSITVGIETPDEGTLKRYKRAPVKDDKQRDFVALCRSLNIRTVAGFMIGFPEDTPKSIDKVLRYAQQVGPTYANFNIVTPYPGTEFFEQVRGEIASLDYSRYSVYHPVMKYKHMTREEVSQQHARCMGKYYFRSRYFAQNAHLLWPVLQKLGFGAEPPVSKPPASKPPTDGPHEKPGKVHLPMLPADERVG